MIKMLAVILLTCGGPNLLAAQAPPHEQDVLLRRYREGEKRVAQSLVFQRLCGFSFKCAFVHPPAAVYDQRPECDSR
jgi:hypothetical protein